MGQFHPDIFTYQRNLRMRVSQVEFEFLDGSGVPIGGFSPFTRLDIQGCELQHPLVQHDGRHQSCGIHNVDGLLHGSKGCFHLLLFGQGLGQQCECCRVFLVLVAQGFFLRHECFPVRVFRFYPLFLLCIEESHVIQEGTYARMIRSFCSHEQLQGFSIQLFGFFVFVLQPMDVGQVLFRRCHVSVLFSESHLGFLQRFTQESFRFFEFLLTAEFTCSIREHPPFGGGAIV
mmetsp:Transcript_5201/g.32664  ORF Transcript_5201/g.32664 Transcript_5201/m.32664 type:complete len:231 (+) Transcript_5201:1260-1952(+)